eukprot:m.4046 g.4046  ORF g.4046 m.4046 type:complete len:485 (+) comp2887_c0_seq1:414-1868(+)
MSDRLFRLVLFFSHVASQLALEFECTSGNILQLGGEKCLTCMDKWSVKGLNFHGIECSSQVSGISEGLLVSASRKAEEVEKFINRLAGIKAVLKPYLAVRNTTVTILEQVETVQRVYPALGIKNASQCKELTEVSKALFCDIPPCVHGKVSKNTCECICDPGWSGNDCSCNTPCVNGNVTGSSKVNSCDCACNSDLWTGDACDEPEPPSCKSLCVHGNVVLGDNNSCQCQCRNSTLYTGLQCDKEVPCDTDCDHGTVVGSKILGTCGCHCDEGWIGEKCDKQEDCHFCDNDGTPQESLGKHCTCLCKDGWTGEYCHLRAVTLTPTTQTSTFISMKWTEIEYNEDKDMTPMLPIIVAAAVAVLVLCAFSILTYFVVKNYSTLRQRIPILRVQANNPGYDEGNQVDVERNEIQNLQEQAAPNNDLLDTNHVETRRNNPVPNRPVSLQADFEEGFPNVISSLSSPRTTSRPGIVLDKPWHTLRSSNI